ncbi:ParB/RepB/Spo0J family partition protein, partial [Candidatus Saccharibacteria bacterium]|nr:ParB/RepB/Spo0J family partition protein [Candidatus Saccharibacteria bacterium]
ANLKKVPTIVRKPKKQERLEIALIENVQRVDLSPLETAVAIEKLHQEFSLGYEEIASRLSKAPATVSNIVRLLQLPQTAMEALQSNEITEGHARAILSLKGNESQQKELLDLILKNSWSVRQAEQYAVSAKQGAKSRPQIAKRMSTTLPGTKKLSQKLTTPVTIKRTARGGRIEIHFKDDSQLEDILKNLNK